MLARTRTSYIGRMYCIAYLNVYCLELVHSAVVITHAMRAHSTRLEQYICCQRAALFEKARTKN